MGELVLAMDRAPSVRIFDEYGRLRVKMTNISKANVCGYMGAEIPNHETLGLDPDRLYMLYRDPAELAKAVDTFNGVPLLEIHIPSVATDHPRSKVVGTTGTDCQFEAPYLQNSLVIWTKSAIDGIESEDKKELSCGYGYRADMTRGRTIQGEEYDGVMRDIIGNHVALVTDGRAGPDVMVGDQQLETTMKKKPLSNKAALAKGALLASDAKLKIAMDKAPELKKVLAAITNKNWLEQKPLLVAALKPHLAVDASMETLVKMLDCLDDQDMVDAADAEEKEPKEKEAEDEDMDDEDGAQDEDDKDDKDDKKDKEAEDEDMDDEDEDKDKKKGAKDEPPPTKGAAKKPGEKGEEMVSKSAMDKAIKLASKQAADSMETKTIARLNAVREAEKIVKPFVGEMAMSFDSAEGVYKGALDALGVDVEDAHPSAYRHILLAQRKPTETDPANPKQSIAQDSAVIEGAFKRFPGLNVRNIG